jgi:putative DNA primase/helicase
MEIEKYAILSERVRRSKVFVEAASWIKALNITSDNLDTNP